MRIRYGTSSWSEKSWNGAFYPAGTKPADQLPFYATKFGAVEADVTYYRVPDAKLVDGWRARTPEGFAICAKFPRSIVHGGDGPTPNAATVLVPAAVREDTERFLAAMARLGDRCGPLVLQLPYFNKQAFTSVAPFLERLDAFLATLPNELRYAVEVRNKSWIAPPLLALLQRHRCALVLVDLAYMPHPDELMAKHDLVTTDFVYARLIGDRKAIDAITDRFDKIVVDQEERLMRWARLLRQLRAVVPLTWIFANNHYAGFAPETIRRLEELVEG